MLPNPTLPALLVGPLAAFDAVDWLAVQVFRWLVTPTRRLPTGMTLAELAGDDLGEFSSHVEGALGGFAATAESRGARYAVWRAAAHGGLACSHWWGTPTWPALVRAFLQVIDDPRHAHWGSDGSLRARLPPAPAQVADRAGLERILRRQPWSLESDAAQWVVNAGIGYLRSPLPTLRRSHRATRVADGDASAVGQGPSQRAVVGMLPVWQTREPSGP